MATTVETETVGDFLSALAAGTPEPGGGAAAALMGATGAALLAMVCTLSLGRNHSAEEDARATRIGIEADELRTRALILAAADAEAYREVIAAQQLPRNTPDERAKRSARIQEALKGATDTPLRTAAVAARVIELASTVLDLVNPNALGDLAVGVLAARASLDASTLNARINASHIRDAAFKEAVRVQLEQYPTVYSLADTIIRMPESRI